MQPNKVSISQLLADGTGFYVPFYQRAYVWTEKLWDRFIKDMEYISKVDEEYFIGSVILKKMGANGIETARWSVVDGQQRLTTLAIFYKVISLKDASTHNPFDKRFRLDDNSLTIKHSLNDKDSFEKIANLTSDVELDGAEHSNLIKAYNYFRANVDCSKINVLNIQARLWFIAIYLEANENEHKIFDTINSLGMNLNTEELLKNRLFTASTLDEYNKIWRPVFEADDDCLTYWKTSLTANRSSSKTMSDRFFHILLQIMMHNSRNKISGEERKEFRKYDEENQFGYYQKIIESGEWGNIEFAQEIADYATLFRKTYKKDIVSDPESFKTPLKRFLLVVFALDVSSAIPYMLYVLKNVQDTEEQDRIWGLLEAYIVRRQICNKVSKNYSDLFTENLIGQHILTYDALCDYLGNKKSYESLHMPFDSEIVESVKTNSSLSAEKARGILYLLESKLREQSKSETILHPFSKYTLEHLMPQKWEDNWSCPSDLSGLELLEFKAQRNEMIGTIGNMAIITQGLNSSISNSSWKKKLELGLAEKASDLITMKDVVKTPSWSETTILKRAKWIADRVNEIWKNTLSIEDEISATNIQHDRTLYSIDSGKTFLVKSKFVPAVIKTYVSLHPTITLEELKEIFPDKVLYEFKRIGLICTEEDIKHKPLPQSGRIPTDEEKRRWYHTNDENAWITLNDGNRIVVSSEITKRTADDILLIAENNGIKIQTKE